MSFARRSVEITNGPSVERVGEEVVLEREMVSKDERVFWASISLDWVWTAVWRLCVRRREKVKQCRPRKKKSTRKAVKMMACRIFLLFVWMRMRM